MNLALDPETGRQISAEQFIARYGHKALGATVDNRPAAICDTCHQNMTHVAGRTDDTFGHFSHRPRSGFCPTKTDTAAPYGKLTPTNPDPEHAKWLRALVQHRWKWVFNEISQRVPYFDALEFLDLMGIADADGLWGYRDLKLTQVPELLLMIRDFTPATSRIIQGKRRPYWVRFWFSADVRSIEDLWIAKPQNVRLLRASFELPTGRRMLPDPNKRVELLSMNRVTFPPPTDPQLHYSYAESVIPSAFQRQK